MTQQPSKRRRTTTETEEDLDSVPLQSQEETCSKPSLAVTDLRLFEPPSRRWVRHEFSNLSGVAFVTCTLDSNTRVITVEKAVLFTLEGPTAVKCQVHVLSKAIQETVEDAQKVLSEADFMPVCCGVMDTAEVKQYDLTKCLAARLITIGDKVYGTSCIGRSQKAGLQCFQCKYLRAAILTHNARLKRSKKKRPTRKHKQLSRRAKRLEQKVSNLKDTVWEMQQKISSMSQSAAEKLLEALPQKQRMAVMHIFEAARRNSTRGMTYQREWILECVLLKMRSPKLYDDLRAKNILAVPSRTTLRKYMSNYKGGFGFNEQTFKILKGKTAGMEVFKRHGGLIVDEMKLSENLSVDARGRIQGFVDVGSYSQQSDRHLQCDHELDVMYVPLVGDCTQILDVFGTRGNVNGGTLAKILVDAIVLAEDAGLYVDYLTCDAATWNRKMWKSMGIDGTKGSVSCRALHPTDDNRSHYFFSDFLHLVKNIRNRLLVHDFVTPDGKVSLSHIKEAFRLDSDSSTLKVMPRITPIHLSPNNFERMRIHYAFQLFGHETLRGLHLYKPQIEAKLGNVSNTEKFIRRIGVLISLMISHFLGEALKAESSAVEQLRSFLDYLDEWEASASWDNFLNALTAEGLRVSISSTIDLLKYVSDNLGIQVHYDIPT